MVQNTIKVAVAIIGSLCLQKGNAQLANEVIASIADVPNRLPETGTEFLGTLGSTAAEALPNAINWQQYLVDSGINLEAPDFESLLNVYQNLPVPIDGEFNFVDFLQNISQQGILKPDQLVETLTSVERPEAIKLLETITMESAPEPLSSMANSVKNTLGGGGVENLTVPMLSPLETIQNVTSAPADSLEAIENIAPTIVPAEVTGNLVNLPKLDLIKPAELFARGPEDFKNGLADFELPLAGAFGGIKPLNHGDTGTPQLFSLVQQFLDTFKGRGNLDSIKTNILPELLSRQLQTYMESMAPQLGISEMPIP